MICNFKYFAFSVNLGLFCSTPGIPLSRAVSKKTAAYMLFTGTPIDAKEALRAGLVSMVVQPEDLGRGYINNLNIEVSIQSISINLYYSRR